MAIPLSASSVQINGTVQGQNAAGMAIAIAGAATGSATTNSSGQFSCLFQHLSAGMITLLGTDSQHNQTNLVTELFQRPAPNLADTVNLGNTADTITGLVLASGIGVQTVSFTGVVTGSTQTDANGNFSYSGAATGYGTITVALVLSPGGGSSKVGIKALPPPPPVLVSFAALAGPNNTWTFSGVVTDQVACMVMVDIGLPNGSNYDVACDSNGNFSMTVTVPCGVSGLASAVATDPWGQSSNELTASMLA
jgi:hypothetical protein